MSKPPSFAHGCIKLGAIFAVRYGLPGIVVALPFILLHSLVSAVEASKLVELASERANLGILAALAGDFLLEGVQAGLAVLILVLIVRRAIRSGAADGSIAGDVVASIRHPLVGAAFRSSWVVFVLLAALYMLVVVSGSFVVENGPRNILYIPLALLIMPLTAGGPMNLLIIPVLFLAVGMFAIYAVRSVLRHSGAVHAADLDVLKPALDRPFGLMRLVLNLTWLYGVPFILLAKWLPTLIFPPTPMPRFADVAAAQAGPERSIAELLIPFLRDFYEGGAIGVGIVFAALAALIVWNKAAAIALHRADATPPTVERLRPWHDPETPLETMLAERPRFGKRSG